MVGEITTSGAPASDSASTGDVCTSQPSMAVNVSGGGYEILVGEWW